MPPRDEQDFEDRRQQIIDCALQVFASKGFEKATNKDIAAASGIGSPGLIYDAVDANTANIASGYISQLIRDYNLRQLDNHLAPAIAALQRNSVQVQISVLYNPGLLNSWFIVPGMIGVVLTVIGSQAASSLVVVEK